jgi:hypothetical protein
MKKIYTIAIMAILTISIGSVHAQVNLIKGGTMEADDADFWSISNLSNASTSTTAYEFGSTIDSPTGGNNGALYMTATNSGADGSHLMVYQQVTLMGGNEYIFDLSAKATMPMLSSWFEVYVGLTEPTEGADYAAVAGQVIALGGWKSTNWTPECDDNFDGNLQEIGCLDGSQGSFIAPGDEEQTFYIGFKVGIWGQATTIEFVVDNVSLYDVNDKTSVDKSGIINKTSVYPNPAKSILNIESSKSFDAVRIINQIGKEALFVQTSNNHIDVSLLNSGLFIVELMKDNLVVGQSRFIKQ